MLAACGGDGDGDDVEIPLAGSVSGTATLEAVDFERTRVVIEIKGAEGRTAGIHEQACDEADPQPTDRLEPVGAGRSETVVEVPLAHLESSPHAIVVGDFAACGTVGG